MLSALWVSKTGLGAQDIALSTISNNLANVSTVGFKKDRAVFQDLLYQIQRQPGAQENHSGHAGRGEASGTGAQAVGVRVFDVSINGEVFEGVDIFAQKSSDSLVL